MWSARETQPSITSITMLKTGVRIVFACLFLLVTADRSAAQTLAPPKSTAAATSTGKLNDQSGQAVTSDQQTFEQRADLYMVRKYFQEAADTYNKALLTQPKNAAIYNKLGIAYHQMLSYDAAKKSYRQAIRLNPRFAQAINNLAAVEYAQKHYKAAIQTYLKALKLTPRDAVIYSNLGTAYFALDRFDYAVTCYRYALSLDPAVFQRAGRLGTIVHQRDEKNAAAFNFYMAKTYAELHDVDNTLLYLRKAWEEGFKEMRKAMEDKVFAFLAPEPKFAELLALLDAADATKTAQPAPAR